MAFQHRFQEILGVRRNQRDIHQQSLFHARRLHSRLAVERDRLVEDRASLLKVLRTLVSAAPMDVGQVLNLQRHAQHIAKELALSEAAVADAAIRVETCIAQLVDANQSVQMLERLAERQNAEHEMAQEKSAAREFDDIAAARYWRGS